MLGLWGRFAEVFSMSILGILQLILNLLDGMVYRYLLVQPTTPLFVLQLHADELSMRLA
jgi:hypothetical protein